MRHLRGSTFDEYVEYYLLREKRKNPTQVLPGTAPARFDVMRSDHSGKLRRWFEKARWCVVLLDLQELESLVFLESDWTKAEGLVVKDGVNYRLLGKVAERAIGSNYLSRTSAQRHLDYYRTFKSCQFRLEGSSRLVICSSSADERRDNPAGQYYLHDGTGRALSYMILVKEDAAMFDPVEAFLAQE